VREKLEMMLRLLYSPADGVAPYSDFKLARKSFLTLIMKSKKTREEIHHAIAVQLGYIERYLENIKSYLSNGRELIPRHMQTLKIIYLIYEQQNHMHTHQSNTIKDRILSLHAWWVRSIYRNKSGAKYEYGTQFDISINNGFARIERMSFDPYNEGSTLPMAVERFFILYGRYPRRVIADTKYRTDCNREFCKKHGIKLIGKPLGSKHEYVESHDSEIRENENKRTEVERKIGLAKEFHGLGLIKTRLSETTRTTIALSIVAMNIALAMKLSFSLYFVGTIICVYMLVEMFYMIKDRFEDDIYTLDGICEIY
jgi:hypothetical protein